MDDISLEEKLIQVLNKARCLEKRTVGNGELARRILAIPEIQESIERRTPKRVVPWSRYIYLALKERFEKPAKCPVCAEIVYGKQPYCNRPGCGQALDWTEEQP